MKTGQNSNPESPIPKQTRNNKLIYTIKETGTEDQYHPDYGSSDSKRHHNVKLFTTITKSPNPLRVATSHSRNDSIEPQQVQHQIVLHDFKMIDQGEHPTGGQSLASGTEYINNSILNHEMHQGSQDALDQPKVNESFNNGNELIAITTGKSKSNI